MSDIGCSTDTQNGQVLKIDGDLSISNADEMHTLFAGSITSGCPPVLDLEAVESCDTAALQLICSFGKSARARGQTFRVLGVSRALADTSAALGLSIDDLSGGASGGQ